MTTEHTSTQGPQTHRVQAGDADLAYDVRGPLPPVGGRPPLLLIGQPMPAAGFPTLAGHFGDRTVVTYDPRGLGRSTRSDGSLVNDPRVAAEDLHALVTQVGGPVEIFGTSGGAVNGLALLETHPDDVVTLVAHEPPLLSLLPDAQFAQAAMSAVNDTYEARGWGHGMAHFVAVTMWAGEYTEEFLAQPAPDPASFGMPTEDDGSRDDPLLSRASAPVTDYRPDPAALAPVADRLVLAAGVGTGEAVTKRTTEALAALLDVPLTMFPGDHGGFLGGEFGQHGEPDAFAAKLREVLG